MKDSRTRVIVAAFLLFLAVFLAYSQTITFDWVRLDDNEYVLRNPIIALPPLQAAIRMFSEGYYNSYIPMTLLSHAVDLKVWGPEPAGHHLTNVVLHSLNAVWVMFLALVFLRKSPGPLAENTSVMGAKPEELCAALLAALLFALHPMRAESVAWVADRKDLLAAGFALPAVTLYLHTRFTDQFRLVSPVTLLSLFLFALSVLAKTSAVAVPGVLLLLEVGSIQRGKGWTARLRGASYTVPYFAVSIVGGLLAMKAAPAVASLRYGVAALPGGVLYALPGYSILFYLWKTLWPFPLVPIYLVPASGIVVAAAVAFILVAVVLGILSWKGRLLVPLAIGSYGILILPTIIGLSASIVPWADRYSYLPTVPVFLFVVFGIVRLLHGAAVERQRMWRFSAVVTAMCFLAMMLVLTVRQTSIWHDELSLWSHQLECGAQNKDVFNNLGVAYLRLGEEAKAREMFKEAVRLEPRDLMALLNLREVTRERTECLDLLQAYKRAVPYNPGFAPLRIAIGEMYREVGMEDSSIAAFRKAVDVDPDNGEGYSRIGGWFLQHERLDSAAMYFETAIQRALGYSQPYYALGMLALQQRDTVEAVRRLTTAARLGHASAKKVLQALNRSW